MKLSYIIYWAEILVGNIFSNEEGKYKYIPDSEGIKNAIDFGLPKILVSTETEWGEIPKVFKERLKLDPECKNFCKLPTDSLKIKKK